MSCSVRNSPGSLPFWPVRCLIHSFYRRASCWLVLRQSLLLPFGFLIHRSSIDLYTTFSLLRLSSHNLLRSVRFTNASTCDSSELLMKNTIRRSYHPGIEIYFCGSPISGPGWLGFSWLQKWSICIYRRGISCAIITMCDKQRHCILNFSISSVTRE